MRLPSSLIHQTITWIHLDTVQRLLWDYCFGLLVLIELKLMNVFCVCDVFVSVNVEGIYNVESVCGYVLFVPFMHPFNSFCSICCTFLCLRNYFFYVHLHTIISVLFWCFYGIIFYLHISTELLFCTSSIAAPGSVAHLSTEIYLTN
eukprot:1094804_1